MKRIFLFSIIMLMPLLLFSQEVITEKEKDPSPKTGIPVLSQYSNRFVIKNIYFNKRIDYSGFGEILEVEFELRNKIDDPQVFYVFVVASYEVKEKTLSSFERPVPPKERLKSFVPYPNDLKNFQYPVKDSNGNIKKDFYGKEIINFFKYPKNSKAGINLYTGKPYHLKDKLVIRTEHLSKYRMNYYFFNNAAILIFNEEGKPVYRQLYDISTWRR